MGVAGREFSGKKKKKKKMVLLLSSSMASTFVLSSTLQLINWMIMDMATLFISMHLIICALQTTILICIWISICCCIILFLPVIDIFGAYLSQITSVAAFTLQLTSGRIEIWVRIWALENRMWI